MDVKTQIQTIADVAVSCRRSFDKCLSPAVPLSAREKSLVEDQLARFSLWTSNIGTFAPGRASMDHRLREAPEVQAVVIGLLEALSDRVELCQSIIKSSDHSDPKEPKNENVDTGAFENAVQAIGDEIALLHKLANTILRASKSSQNSKSASFKIKDEEGNDMEPFLKHQFSRNLLDQFPGLSEALKERLSTTMVLRRKRILYRRWRYGKIAIQPGPTIPQPMAKPKPAAVSPTPCNDIGENAIPPSRPAVSGILPLSVVQSNIRSATTLAPGRFQKASTPSVVSAAKTIALSDHQDLAFPPAPQAHIKERFLRLKANREADYAATVAEARSRSFEMSEVHLWNIINEADEQLREGLEDDLNECRNAVMETTCPFCFYSLSSLVVNNTNKWRNHVKNDLDAYVCLFEDCDKAYELYNHSEDWLRHMRQHTLRWHCKAKSHGLLRFETREEYETHMRANHPATFTEAQLPLLADRNSRSREPLFESCPLCGSEKREVDGRLEDHIVGHLRFLALKSLPRLEEDDSDESSSGSSMGTYKPPSRSTMRDDPYRGVRPEFIDEKIRSPYVRSKHESIVPPEPFKAWGGFSGYVREYPNGASMADCNHFSPPEIPSVDNQTLAINLSGVLIDVSGAFIDMALFDGVEEEHLIGFEWGFLPSNISSPGVEVDPILTDMARNSTQINRSEKEDPEAEWSEFIHEFIPKAKSGFTSVRSAAKLSGFTDLTKMAQDIRAKGQLLRALNISTGLLQFRSQPENLGPDHIGTASLIPMVALLNEESGSWASAEELWLSLFKWRKKQSGMKDEETRDVFLRYENAFIRAHGGSSGDDLGRRTTLLGEDHPLTLDIMQQLSMEHLAQDRLYIGAGQLRDVYDTRKRVQGPGHIDTLDTMDKLARALDDLGQFEEANTLYVDLLRFRRIVLETSTAVDSFILRDDTLRDMKVRTEKLLRNLHQEALVAANDLVVQLIFAAATDGLQNLIEWAIEITRTIPTSDKSWQGAKDDQGRTPLFLAASKGHEKVVQMLLRENINYNTGTSFPTPSDCQEAFVAAASMGHEAVFQRLLHHVQVIFHVSIDEPDSVGDTALECAVQNNHEGVVRLLICRGAELGHIHITRGSLLMQAVRAGYTGVAKAILEADQARYLVDQVDDFGRTSLSFAAERGNIELCYFLLERGADVNASDDEKWTPIFRAAVDGHESICRLLLESGADVSARDRGGKTPILCAADAGQETICRLLLEAGADVSTRDGGGRTPIFYAADAGHESICRLLLEAGADVNASDEKRMTPLMTAVSGGHVSVTRLLLRCGAEIDHEDIHNWTALMRSAANGSEPILKILLEAGANPNLRNGLGTPLMNAAWKGHEGVVKLLLEAGVDPAAAEADGRTTLMISAGNGHERVVKLLLEAGVDPATVDTGGRTALMNAAWNGYEEVVKILLEAGANPNQRSSSGTPLMNAAWKGYEEVVKLLLEAGVDPATVDTDGRTALMNAAWNGHEGVVKLLLEAGVDPAAADTDGRTALMIATLNGYERVVKLLLEAGVDPATADI